MINFLKNIVSKNNSWIVSEYLFRAVLTILLLGYVAKEFGPKYFGVLNFGFSLISLGLPLCKLGLDSIIIRELSNNKVSLHPSILFSAFFILCISGFLSFILLNVIVHSFLTDSLLVQLLMILSISYLFYDFLVIDFYFQSVKKIKLSALSKFIAFSVSGVLKIIALKIQLSFLWIALVFSLDGLLLAIVLFSFLYRSVKISELFRYQSLSLGVCRDLLRSSHPMITSGIAGILLTKVDQLMIAHYMTYEDVGLYSACSRIYDGWMSFIYILSISLLPAMLTNKKLSKSMHVEKATEYFFIAIMLSFFFALLSSFFGYFLLKYLYGDLYVGAYLSMVILAWASLFSSFGYLSSRFLIVEGFEKKISRRNWGALFINVVLNYILIPYLGIIGASIATFMSVFIAHYIFDFFDSELKPLLSIKNDALLRMIGK